MSLLSEVVAVLEAAQIEHALIGAAAMAVHGVSRATADVDILTVNTKALQTGLWSGLKSSGAGVRTLKGDPDDPLAGNVRVSRRGERTVDVVVGRHSWQQEILEFAPITKLGDVALRVTPPAGLILLKLHAGGPRDAWDIRALLETLEQPDLVESEVDRSISKLPAECRSLWQRLREGT